MRSLKALPLAQLPPLPLGIEVLLLTSVLQDDDQNDLDEDPLRQTLALVLLQPKPAVRHAARAIAASYVNAQACLHQAPLGLDPCQWLGDLLCRDEFERVVLMVATSEDCRTDVLTAVAELPSSLRQRLDMRLDCLIWIAATPAPWAAERIASLVGDQYAALQAVEVFSLLMAPSMVHCCDLWDLTEVVAQGTSSRIIAAHWIAAERRLVLPSESDARLLSQSTGVIVAQPFTLTLRDVAAINRHARSLLSGKGEEIVIDGQNLRVAPGGTIGSVVPVLLIARLRAQTAVPTQDDSDLPSC